MPKTMPRRQLQPSACASQAPSSGGDRCLRDRARDGDAANGQQLLEVELQADAEHQQDDADFGELFGDRRVDDEPGVFGPTSVPASR